MIKKGYETKSFKLLQDLPNRGKKNDIVELKVKSSGAPIDGYWASRLRDNVIEIKEGEE